MKKDRQIEIKVDGAEPPPDDLKTRVAELELQLADAEKAAAQARDDLLRRAADLDNTKKRLQRDYERACDAAARALVEKLLPALDDLTRAIDAADADAAVPQPHVDALRLFDRKLYDVLKTEGLEVIAPRRSDPFDPEVHEAVMTTCDALLAPGLITRVVSAGYRFKGQLLKAAVVEVCVEPPTATV